MIRDLRTGLISMVVITILFGLGYPLLVTGLAQGIFAGKANGSLIKRDGVVVGSALIGQQFYQPVLGHNGKQEVLKGVPQTQPDPRYFQTRPSATDPADNAAGSTFSNLGPNNIATEQEIAGNVQSYLALDIAPDKQPYDPALKSAAQVPVDAADSSASGVDPDISVANAKIQAHRVAAVRGLTLRTVEGLVAKYTTARSLGFLGEPGVDVLELNLALDRISASR
jgi:K+-transporting ATPase ATPase C chain